jgi:hypothetical protein
LGTKGTEESEIKKAIFTSKNIIMRIDIVTVLPELLEVL